MNVKQETTKTMSPQEFLNRRARARLRWIEHYEQVSKKVAPTCRYFGITRTTFYRWYHRYMRLGIEGLKDKSSRPHHIQHHIPKDIVEAIIMLRYHRSYGAVRMSDYIRRKHGWFVSAPTIWRIYKRHNVSRLRYRKKWQRYPQKYSKANPGERVQVDVKFLQNLDRLGRKYYQFTAIDDCTRYRVLRIYDHNTVKNATEFVEQVKKALPFAIQQIQTDNGKEFSEQFSWYLEDLGIEHRKTKVRSPEENGKVEWSHRTDEEEFYRTKKFVSIKHCIHLLRQWEKEYNEERPHTALGWKTPKEYLTEKLKTHLSSKVFTHTRTVAEVG